MLDKLGLKINCTYKSAQSALYCFDYFLHEHPFSAIKFNEYAKTVLVGAIDILKEYRKDDITKTMERDAQLYDQRFIASVELALEVLPKMKEVNNTRDIRKWKEFYYDLAGGLN